MYLQPNARHIAPLKSLWQTAFGDDPAYIALFFDGTWQRSHTFADFENGQLVSALYLLDCFVVLGGKQFSGYYLYAAATLPDFRKQGRMAGLLEEAKAFAAQQGRAFIALVPGEPSLTAYYEKFGFFTAMHRYAGHLQGELCTPLSPITPQAYYEAAAALSEDRFLWTRENHAYALSCLAYNGCLPYAAENGVLLTDGKSTEELLAQTLPQCFGGSCFAPRAYPDFEKQPFGMIFAADPALKQALKQKTIYMNLALD